MGQQETDEDIIVLQKMRAMFNAHFEQMNRRFEALKNALFQYLELSSSMGLSTIKANLKTI